MYRRQVHAMLGALALTCSLASTAGADAGAGSEVDKPTAVRLFEEGRKLLAEGRADAACKKFEQSIRKDPRAVGTLLNLGLCNERQGKIATALALFVEAFDRASESGQTEQCAAAEEHIQALRPRVPIVVLSYLGAQIEGEKLVVDDRVISRDETELALDPGPHSIVFTAPGRLPYETTLVVKASMRTPVLLPELATPGSARRNPRRLAGQIATFGGAGLVVGAGVLALVARSQYRAQFEGAMPHCGVAPPIDGREVCDAQGAAAVADARSLARTATIVGGIGVAAATVGLTLWLTAPSERARVVATASATGGGLAIVGRF
jgi:hypothetical protein